MYLLKRVYGVPSVVYVYIAFSSPFLPVTCCSHDDEFEAHIYSPPLPLDPIHSKHAHDDELEEVPAHAIRQRGHVDVQDGVVHLYVCAYMLVGV